MATINRPRTAQGNLGTGRMSPAPGSLSDLRDTDYMGTTPSLIARSSTASPGPSPTPDQSLRAFRSEANLKLTLGARNLSSSSLALPPRRFDSPGPGDAGPRPGTAHSMRGYADRPAPVLHLNLANTSTPTLGLGSRPPRSPLGQFELESPVKSDSESLLGDEPDRIADGIKARLAREEEDAAKARAAEQEKRWAQAQMATQRQRRMNAEGVVPRVAYPSPPSSIEGEHDVPTLSVPVPRSSLKSSARSSVPFQQDARSASRGNDSTVRPMGNVPTPRAQISPVDNDSSRGRGGRLPVAEGSVPSQKAPTQDSSSGGSKPERRERTNHDGNSTSRTQLLKPEDSLESTRGTKAPAQAISKAAPRSPLFQQMSPFDVHSEEEGDDDDDTAKPIVDHRAANAPYGLPSPPLSHRTRPSDEEEGLPVLRNVEAKRDTMVVGVPGRESLGLQIEEFEKSLQQAQAMSALEKGPDDIAAGIIDVRIMTRSRTGSNGSSNYSDMSESPMTIEPPLVSPKPFPLSPRPMSPGGRLRATAAEAAQPALEVRPESPFGSARLRTAAIQAMRRKGSEDKPESPAAGMPLRPRVAAATPRRPTLEEYGGVKVNTVASLAGRIRRPSPDEYGIRIKTFDTPVRTASPFRMDAAPDMESPILKESRPLMTFESPSEAQSEYTNSAATSRANSPISSGTGSGSYSVFSPPQPPAARRHVPAPAPPSRSVQAEWQFGPAPTAPPTLPLPIPERSAARRKDTFELAAQRRHEQQPHSAAAATPVPAPLSPGLASSASIVPDPDANPNWPLPGPSSPSLSRSTATDPDLVAPAAACNSDKNGGVAARRPLLREGRTPLAPLNIAAARYADEINSFGGVGGPWTPEPAVEGAGFDVQGRCEPPAAPAAELLDGEDKSSVIGVARGLSIKYDRVRDAERRAARGQERARLRVGASAWRLEEQEEGGEEEEIATAIKSPMLPVSPPTMTTTMTGEPFDRLRRPNQGLKSPTGIADEQGIRFI